MGQARYIQPESCSIGKYYYLQTTSNGNLPDYKKVRFIGYRPHPAEVLVQDGNRIRVIHRRALFLKERDSRDPC